MAACRAICRAGSSGAISVDLHLLMAAISDRIGGAPKLRWQGILPQVPNLAKLKPSRVASMNGRIAGDGRNVSYGGGGPIEKMSMNASANAAVMVNAANAASADALKRNTNAVKLAMESYQPGSQRASTAAPAANAGMPAQRPAKKVKEGYLAHPGHAPLLPLDGAGQAA
mgnify:CR=1 FL=1